MKILYNKLYIFNNINAPDINYIRRHDEVMVTHNIINTKATNTKLNTYFIFLTHITKLHYWVI